MTQSITAACLIETMRLNQQGQIVLLALHLQRLKRSALQLGFYYNQADVLNALKPYLHKSYNTTQRLRLTLTANGQLHLQCSELNTTATPVLVKLWPVSLQADTELLRHKTTARSHWQAGEQWLTKHPRFFDVLYADANGNLSEGGRSNIYIWQQNQWITPPLSQALLGGVQRQYLLNKGWVKEQRFDQQQLLSAPKVRISNALRGWLDASISS